VRSTKLSRRIAPAAVGVMLVAAQVATQAPAAAASPLSELRRYSVSSLLNSEPTRNVTALCPAGKVIVGGGGRVVELGFPSPQPSHQLTLTQLEPSRSILTQSGNRHGYIVSAAETIPGTDNLWYIDAWALCAKPVAGLAIYEQQSGSSSDSVQATAVGCPTGQVVLGSGARITYPVSPGGRGVALQVVRPSGTGDIARAQAHENPNGYSGSWMVTASAICAPKPSGYQVVFGASLDPSTSAVKTATSTCPGSLRMISAGAATSTIAPGNVSLTEVNPQTDRTVQSKATENFPTSQDWDFVVASAVCATAT
jgi:hypothetical protein